MPSIYSFEQMGLCDFHFPVAMSVVEIKSWVRGQAVPGAIWGLTDGFFEKGVST
jgi:hypothetical protein